MFYVIVLPEYISFQKLAGWLHPPQRPLPLLHHEAKKLSIPVLSIGCAHIPN